MNESVFSATSPYPPIATMIGWLTSFRGPTPEHAAAAPKVERRLAAIVATDVVGYTRLIAADEAGTLAVLKAHYQGLIEPKVAEYGGRIVRLVGDGALLEFPSVVDAVQCAVDIQHGMAARNRGVPAERRVEFRIGINLGDVIVADGDLHGDAVNVAARLEALAEPGGIWLSQTVRDQVQDKLPVAFEDLGEQQLRNFPRPIHAFRVAGGPRAAHTRDAEAGAAPRVIAAALVAGLVAGCAWVWQANSQPAAVEPASVQQTESPARSQCVDRFAAIEDFRTVP